ncbi:hypothetical protein ASG21_03940 [Chryseobacterium sp. Leaf394]|nr:hypothetical protein ASG21_03940 [Chryseobacterium sp. Leaf394]
MILVSNNINTMKKLKILSLSLISASFLCQITIGKTTPTLNSANSSVSLELGNATGGNKGMILPWVTSEIAVDRAGSVAGTLIFDTAPGVQKVKYKTSNEWIDLSAGARSPLKTITAEKYNELPAARAMIGGDLNTDKTPGVLILAAADKAMILPRVSSVAEIIKPSAGMIVYVTGSENGLGPNAKQMAVFNGREWTFWTKN